MIDAQEGYDLGQLAYSIEAHSKQKQLAYLNEESKERTFNYSQTSQTITNNKLMSKVIPLVLF